MAELVLKEVRNAESFDKLRCKSPEKWLISFTNFRNTLDQSKSQTDSTRGFEVSKK